MNTQTRKTLFDSLEREFCPTLDSSLLAALLVEIESDIEGNTITPTEHQIDALRSTLSALSLQAEEAQLSEFSDVQLTSQFDETISSWTTLDNGSENMGGTSGSSVSSSQSFSSPLGFLQAALPEIPKARLNQALENAEKEGTDMWDIVAGILTEESIRELEERGFDGLEDDETYSEIPDDNDWETVETKKKVSQAKVVKRKAQPRPKKIALADIRQQHQVHHLHSKTHGLNIKQPTSAPTADPWTQISSLSEYLSNLLPPHPPSTFQSFFHSPEHATPYDALRVALASLCEKPTGDSDGHTTVLFNLLDVIMPEYENSDEEHRSRIISDVQLAVSVTQGRGDDSLDIVNLLRDLDLNADLGVYHQQPTQPWQIENESLTISRSRLPSSPPPIQPPPLPKVKQKPPPQFSSREKPSPYEWQAVPQRKRVDRGPHPLAHHIPAYTRDVNGMKTSRAFGSKGGRVDSDANDFRRQMGETMRKRNEALREASRMWQKGNAKTRGGEVAFYFAERAREFQEVARQEALNAARAMVHAKRTNSGNSDTVDLHGTTVVEAIVIIKEILNGEASSISQAKPMKIITGRGTHSVNQVGVLKPAVRKALIEDGWVVGAWDGGLIVRQRRT
ncbi:hypothetical protein BDZ97DRAFT_1808314 [Flammula alnicola]|nr:hypothetical protein BDZ97DRAFT_1808314 [Flammula alnicola]